jgi:catechol 2,3-dioxygenase-like lactoylglutathione lyase family enzyme
MFILNLFQKYCTNPDRIPPTHTVVDWNRDVAFCHKEWLFGLGGTFMIKIRSNHTGPALLLRVAGSALFLSFFALATAASANEANLTRFGPETYEREKGKPTTASATFKAIDGPAELVLQDNGLTNAQIKVNGHHVVDEEDFSGDGEFVVPLTLNQENTIEVRVLGKPGGKLGVRVTQFTETDLNVRAQMYFGLNTSDFFSQLDFYSTLGIVGHIYPAGPEECKTFAQSLGFPDNYLIRVALSSFTGAPPWIDTVGFREFSYRDDPPYANLNHIGMAYATYSTTDLDGDYTYLMGQGVEFVSEPTTAPNGERFVFLKDQDGTFLKLIEESGATTEGPDLVRLVNTNMNVADLERSREFYRLLGFTEEEDGAQAGSGDFAAAHGFDDPIEFEGVDVSLPGTGAPFGGDDEATLQLRQWKTPFNGAPPYSPPVNHLGIDRIAFFVDDLNAAMDEMNRLGFEQLGPIGGGATVGGVGIVFFYDPDRIKVELWGPVSEVNPNSSCE